MENKLKARLIEAAIAADRSGKVIRIHVRPSGVCVTLLREVGGRMVNCGYQHIGWTAIEYAVQNPIPLCIRDLTNQLEELEGR